MTPPQRPLAALTVTAGALGAGALVPLLPKHLRFPANAVTAASAIAIARWSDTTWDQLGADPRRVRRGVAYGAAAALVAAAAIVAGARHPQSRALFADGRVTGVSPARAAFEVAVRIPVATALVEETLFRGAVLGTWERAAGPVVGSVVSSAAFGLWHVIPALESHTHNPAGARISARAGGRPAHIGATVAATTAAGLAFAALRVRTRSIVAPLVAHAAINQLAYLAARWAHAPRRNASSV